MLLEYFPITIVVRRVLACLKMVCHKAIETFATVSYMVMIVYAESCAEDC